MIEDIKEVLRGKVRFVCVTAAIAIAAVQLITPVSFDLAFAAINVGIVYLAARYGNR